MKDILLKSKLCLGPMSKNIVDGIIDFCNKTNTSMTLIPSRRQIEWDGGYVNNWKTKEFVEYVKSKTKLVAIQRDHAGPGQGKNDDDGYVSIKEDCKYMDAIHIDPWKKYQKFEEGLKWTIDMLNFCYNENKNLYFEIGTEEAIRKFSVEEIDRMLFEVQKNVLPEIFDRILFCVIQSGTALKDGLNIGEYNNSKLDDMINIIKKYNKLSKEHNGDYMDKEIMIDRFNNKLDSLNIAPELGVYETKLILNNLIENNEEETIELFYNMCYESKKWVKWVSENFKPENNKHKLIEICGHYVFSYKDFEKVKKIDDGMIRNELVKYIDSIFQNSNIFYKKSFLRTINRVHPPVDEQIVDDRLRLHRAERLVPFSKTFFQNFMNTITDRDFRYYPYTHELKSKLAKKFNLQQNNIFLNNGSSENIRIFYDCFAIKNKEVVITNPCYPMHKIYSQLNEAIVKEIKYNEEKTIDVSEFINSINSNVSCITLANPNSPIGDIIELNNIENIIKKANEYNIPILIDEAYIEYSDQESCIGLLKKYENLVISRTFSKALGCAGLRIGYLLGNTNIMNVIYNLIPTYEISSISCKFGCYLLDNYEEVEKYIALIKKEKIEIGKLCKENNIPHILNNINTIFLKPKNLDKVTKYLTENNVLFRKRVLPYDSEEWLAIVLYPNFVAGDIFKKIMLYNN